MQLISALVKTQPQNNFI